jgi:hypothetical protein
LAMRRKRAQLLPGTGCTGRRIAMGMTAEVAGMPCKHRRPGSIPGVSTGGIEEDGNLPDSDSGETRFDSAGPDVTGCSVRVSARALGACRRGSSPRFPTMGL